MYNNIQREGGYSNQVQSVLESGDILRHGRRTRLGCCEREPPFLKNGDDPRGLSVAQLGRAHRPWRKLSPPPGKKGGPRETLALDSTLGNQWRLTKVSKRFSNLGSLSKRDGGGGGKGMSQT